MVVLSWFYNFIFMEQSLTVNHVTDKSCDLHGIWHQTDSLKKLALLQTREVACLLAFSRGSVMLAFSRGCVTRSPLPFGLEFSYKIVHYIGITLPTQKVEAREGRWWAFEQSFERWRHLTHSISHPHPITAARRCKECWKAALCKTDFNRYLSNGRSNQKN